MSISENRRVDSLRVRLSEDMTERFESLANRYSMPAATLAAFAISRFVIQEDEASAISREMQRFLASRRHLSQQDRTDGA